MDVPNQDTSIDIELPSTSSSSSQEVPKLIDCGSQTYSSKAKTLHNLHREVKTLKQKVRRRNLKIANMKELLQSISKSGHSNESLDEVLKKHFEGKSNKFKFLLHP